MTSDGFRQAEGERTTKETAVSVSVDIDGTGAVEVSTGLPFFDHMLEQLGRHGGFDLVVRAEGDLAVDAHHTVEDVGIVLGGAVARALGDKAGVRRFASVLLPLDEALVEVALDLSGRPFLAYDVPFAPDVAGLGSPPFDSAVGRGVLAGLRHRRGHHPPRAAPGGQEHPPHRRGHLQGGGPRPARRGAGRGRGHPLDQGRPVSRP